MKINKVSLGIATVLLLTAAACKNNGDRTAATKGPASMEDSLYKQVIELHDAAMPKMGKLRGFQTVAQNKIDSLSALLSKKKDAGVAGAKAEYENLLLQLKAAEKGMNDWMDGFDPDPKFPTKDELIKYYEEQKRSATKMKEDVFNAMDSAKAKLGL